MKVLWLGAGASVSAGYPTAQELLAALELMVQRGSDVFTEEAWRRFVAFRESATGVDRTILMSRNPEVVLSLPDLWDAALEADNRAIEADTSIAIRKLRQGLLNDADVKAEAMSFE